MAVIKSSSEHLTLNADGAGKEIKFQANGVEVASISSTGNLTSTGIDDNATSTAITIDNSGNVGIGTNSPDAALDIEKGNGAAVRITLPNGGTTIGDVLSSFETFSQDTSSTPSNTVRSSMRTIAADLYGWQNMLTFGTTGVDGVNVERMRIANNGKVTIGTTAQYGKLTATSTTNGTFGIASIGTDYAKSSRVTSGAGYADFFYTGTGSTFAGYIYANGGTTTYATASDYRLKENVVPMTGSIDRLKALKPSKFNFIGEDKTVDGFLAHEAQSVVPECVHGTKDGMKDEEYEVTPAVMDGETVVTEAVMGTRSVPDYQGIDQSKLVPLLVASLQEAVAKIESLEARVELLETPLA